MISTTTLDARLLAAFHAVDNEDMQIILSYVEHMAERRKSQRRTPPALRVIDCRKLARITDAPIN